MHKPRSLKIIPNAGNSLEPSVPKCENLKDWTISRKGDDMLNEAYLYGVLLGDGFYGYRYVKKEKLGPDYVMLKACDKEFVEKFRDAVSKITDKTYSIYEIKPERKNNRPQYLCKCYAPEIVKESLKLTHNKTEIPNFVLDANDEVKKSFLQGLMDSEGYVTLLISPLKMSHIGIYFGCTSAYTKDIWHMFQNVGIEVSKLYTRKFKNNKQKDLFYFKINITDYVEKGMTFNINRKRERLDFISQILRDYTYKYRHSYWKNYVQDIVRPVAKAVGS